MRKQPSVTRRRRRPKPAPVDIVYRFPVHDQKTGHAYFVVIRDDGLAYREDVAPSYPHETLAVAV